MEFRPLTGNVLSSIQVHRGQADVFHTVAIVSELELVQLGHIGTTTALERRRLVDRGLGGAARGEAGQVEDPAPPGGSEGRSLYFWALWFRRPSRIGPSSTLWTDQI